MHVIHVVLERVEARLDWIGHGIGRLAGRRTSGDLWGGEGIAVDEGMPRGAALDFAQTDEIAALEVAVAVLEFPERRVGGGSVEDVADLVEAVHVELADEGGDVGVLEVRGEDL